MDSISERSVESVQNKLHGKPRNNTEVGEGTVRIGRITRMGLNGSVRIGRITRRRMDRDIRKISEIRTEQKQTTRKTTENHGGRWTEIP